VPVVIGGGALSENGVNRRLAELLDLVVAYARRGEYPESIRLGSGDTAVDVGRQAGWSPLIQHQTEEAREQFQGRRQSRSNHNGRSARRRARRRTWERRIDSLLFRRLFPKFLRRDPVVDWILVAIAALLLYQAVRAIIVAILV
jgi:hypothetical protein